VSGYSVLVLAAGVASRMGANKLLETLWGRPLVSWSVEQALTSGADEVVVVLGYMAERVSGALPRCVRVVVNDAWAEGISSSIRAGVAALSPSSDAVVIMLADQPLTPGSLVSALAGMVLLGGAPASSASVGGDPRSPAAFHRRVFGELLKLRGDVGAKAVVRRHMGEAALLEVAEELLVDVDTREDLELLRSSKPPPG